MNNITVLGTLLGTLAGVLVTYLLGRRKSSGTTATSEAGEIFKAQQDFNANILAQMDRASKRADDAEKRAVAAAQDAAECRIENQELKARVLKLESEADSAMIIAEAKIQAEEIRARAKVEAEAVVEKAAVVKEALDRKEEPPSA